MCFVSHICFLLIPLNNSSSGNSIFPFGDSFSAIPLFPSRLNGAISQLQTDSPHTLLLCSKHRTKSRKRALVPRRAKAQTLPLCVTNYVSVCWEDVILCILSSTYQVINIAYERSCHKQSGCETNSLLATLSLLCLFNGHIFLIFAIRFIWYCHRQSSLFYEWLYIFPSRFLIFIPQHLYNFVYTLRRFTKL